MKHAKLSSPRLIKTDHAFCFGLKKMSQDFLSPTPHLRLSVPPPLPSMKSNTGNFYLETDTADHQLGTKAEAAAQNMKRDASWPTIGMDAKGDCVEVSSICSCALTL